MHDQSTGARQAAAILTDAVIVRHRHFARVFSATVLIAAVCLMVGQTSQHPISVPYTLEAQTTVIPDSPIAEFQPHREAPPVTSSLRTETPTWYEKLTRADLARQFSSISGDMIGLFRAHPLSPYQTAEVRRIKRQGKAVALADLRRFVGARKIADHGPEKPAPLAAIDVDTTLFNTTPPRAQPIVGELPESIPVPENRPELTAVQKTAVKRQSTFLALSYAPAGPDLSNEDGVYGGLNKVFRTSPSDEPGLPTGHWTGRLPGRGSKVAVYDISGATVYMPDGTKLEAHSGLGPMLDNPKYTKRRNKGPTPPNVYNLRMRERLFHGVEAVRMLPVDVKKMHGRNGILTHSPLRRGSIGSAGCIAFQDYAKFLKAYKSGKVKQIIVVPHLGELPTYLAML
ncbi:DUF2778 domain-containing protein [Roseibium sp. CAU 1637]|uniref:DUF2778 domain-containing protein n=1 Tax=Roseibium limicola TaxID=2816037 RepID=A0A939ENE3_9HYPH|nr:DUF2778 domain-containing protein [Roseibium limicola]MBO0345955.1 DUF2778 domain-containing protein [Roseibium limicola]